MQHIRDIIGFYKPRRRPSSWVFSGSLFPFSPTAESFGVSAQIGVVRGGLEVRFHQGSTRVPPGPGFARAVVVRGGSGWFAVRFHHGFTRVAPGFHQGFSRVAQRSTSSARAAGWSGLV